MASVAVSSHRAQLGGAELQVVKMRGQGQSPGLHTARTTDNGLRVFPRLSKPEQRSMEVPLDPKLHRLSTGVPVLDQMMGGGIPAGVHAAGLQDRRAPERPC